MNAPLRLLLVDDDEVDRLAVRRWLTRLQVPVHIAEASSLEESLAQLDAGEWDVVLLDFHLGGVTDAFAFLQALQARARQVPVVVLTGQGDERVAVELLQAGAADYLPKGRLTGDLLWRALRRAVDVHREAMERRRAEAALREREALLTWVVAAAPVPLLTLGTDGRVREANQAAGRLLGVPPASLVGRRWEELVAPSAQEVFRTLWQAGEGEAELAVQGGAGGAVPVEASVRSLAVGEQRHAVVALRDLRPERAAARRAAVERAALRALADARDEDEAIGAVLAALGQALGWECVLYWEREGDVLRCRRAWAREPGRWAAFLAQSHELRLQRGEPIPGWVWDRGEPLWLVDVHEVANVRRRAVAAELTTALAVPVPLEGEDLAVVELFTTRREESDASLQDLVHSLGVLIGRVLVQRRAERQVRRAEAIQRRLAHAGLRLGSAIGAAEVIRTALELAVAEPPAEQALLVCAPAGEVAWSERTQDGDLRCAPPLPRPMDIRWAALEDWALEVGPTGAPLPPPFAALLRELGVPVAPDAYALAAPLLARGERLGWLLALRRGNGFAAGDPLFFEELARRTAVALDQARLLQQAQEAAALRDEILAIVSHDLRNPLSAIYTSAATLLEFPLSEPQRRQQLDIIRRAAERMGRLIDDLLDVSLLESGRFEIRRERVSVAALLEELVAQHAPVAAERGLQLELELASDLPDLWGDRDRLLQALGNLVGNALKFTPAGGRVVVRAEAGPETVRVEVADTGIGIEPDALPHIFDRFWQARRQRRAGVGLGLAIAKGIVEAHRGRIDVASAPGQGTTFRVELP